MINVITDLTDEQKAEVKERLYNLNNICVCDNCNALIQFDDKDICRTKILPQIWCPCTRPVQLHHKYYKSKGE